jgi:predicted nucleotidyltransferase
VNTLLEGIVGSTAYGLATATSDVDKLGIMQLPSEHFLGLSSPTEGSLSKVSTNPDVTYHDVGKFCRLALGCNPTVTELLWLPKDLYTVMTNTGAELIWMRDRFLSAKRVQDAYMGYAIAQFLRLERDGDFGPDLKKRTEKHARHLLRLMHQGYTLYTTGELPIVLEDPERYHEFGRMVAENTSHARQTIDTYKQMFATADTVLPVTSDTEGINRWLIKLRKSHP